jgi:hypothetical protein
VVTLTKSELELLARIERGNGLLLRSQIDGSGGRATLRLGKLVNSGLVEFIHHPTVMDRRWNEPATAVRITEMGRGLLRK